MHTPDRWLTTLSLVAKKRRSASNYFRPPHTYLPYVLLKARMVAARTSEFVWARQVVKKWLNIKSSADEFNADSPEEDEESSEWDERDHGYDWESPRTEEASPSGIIRDSMPERLLADSPEPAHNNALMRWQSEPLKTDLPIRSQEYRISVGTWNVAGQLPPDELELEEWLDTGELADIYVLGFQEVVPLNAGNVLGAEDDVPAAKWDSLIRQTLTKMAEKQGKSTRDTPFHLLHSISEGGNDKAGSMSRATPRKIQDYTPLLRKPTSDLAGDDFGGQVMRFTFTSQHENAYTAEEALVSPVSSPLHSTSSASKSSYTRPGYFRAASKQMVGIFITIWVRTNLRRYVHNIKVSSVGLGLMGYMGNKGSVSISMSLYQTSLCFVCAHLTSGDKGGDELKRNSDVQEILKRTHFPRTSKFAELPETVLGHDRIIWLGDLNYRLVSSASETRQLVARQQWGTLLTKDQLKLEQRAGRIFDGWHEGPIYFAPTYKYIVHSDHYFGQVEKPGEKQRIPAWCDRILWYGKGLTLTSYTRSESQLSDHRPVTGVFLAEVEIDARKVGKTWANQMRGGLQRMSIS